MPRPKTCSMRAGTQYPVERDVQRGRLARPGRGRRRTEREQQLSCSRRNAHRRRLVAVDEQVPSGQRTRAPTRASRQAASCSPPWSGAGGRTRGPSPACSTGRPARRRLAAVLHDAAQGLHSTRPSGVEPRPRRRRCRLRPWRPAPSPVTAGAVVSQPSAAAASRSNPSGSTDRRRSTRCSSSPSRCRTESMTASSVRWRSGAPASPRTAAARTGRQAALDLLDRGAHARGGECVASGSPSATVSRCARPPRAARRPRPGRHAPARRTGSTAAP